MNRPIHDRRQGDADAAGQRPVGLAGFLYSERDLWRARLRRQGEPWAKQCRPMLSLLVVDGGHLRAPVVVPGESSCDMEMKIDLLAGWADIQTAGRASRLGSFLDGEGSPSHALEEQAKICIREFLQVQTCARVAGNTQPRFREAGDGPGRRRQDRLETLEDRALTHLPTQNAAP